MLHLYLLKHIVPFANFADLGKKWLKELKLISNKRNS